MVRVAFWFDAPLEYSGGLNYIRNLLFAVSLVNDGSVEPYVFFPVDVSEEIVSDFAGLATVIRTRILQPRTIPGFIHKVVFRLLGSMFFGTRLLKSYGIDVVSHVWFVYRRPPFRVIGWIPDFQYLHLPELFPGLDPAAETRLIQRQISFSDLVVLSSNAALKDFKRVSPTDLVTRGRVLRFVSQPKPVQAAIEKSVEELERQYDFHGPFFFLPNQFWVHKNHLVVLRAVKILKEENINICVVCTGNPRDYRQTGVRYVDELHEFVTENRLQSNVKLLGMIDYGDVLLMMQHAIAIVNPSRFEGWSSTVEEAKSVGKPVVLSRIDVHIEQDPAEAYYFEPDDAEALSKILAELWEKSERETSQSVQTRAREELHRRTLDYGKAYLALLDEVTDSRREHRSIGLKS